MTVDPATDLRSLGEFAPDDRDRPIAAGLESGRPNASMMRINSFYFATDTNKLWFSNGVSWIQLTQGALAGVPVGTLVQYVATAAPSGWLLCDGTAVSRTTYADLYAVIGTTYGIGDGSTTFNLPDLRGRVPVGKGAHADVNALGKDDGLADASRSPNHDHGGATGNASPGTDSQGSHSHGTATGTAAPGTDSQGSHSHGGGTGNAGGHGHTASTGGPSNVINVSGTTPYGVATNNHTHTVTVDGVGDHSHSIGGDGGHTHTVNSHSHGISADGSHAHTVNSHNHSVSGEAVPFQVFNFIIKT